jgi:hypothetical protein
MENQTEVTAVSDDALVDLDHASVFKSLLEAYQKTGDKKYLDPNVYFKEKYEFFPHDPVSCEKWLYDDEYFGHVGKAMWPVVKEEFFRIMESNPRPGRLILKGSIGWGKTWLSSVIMARIMYELCCLRSPQLYYGLSPTSMIAFMNLSVSGGHAYRVMFVELLNMIDSSPWFVRYMPRKRPGSAAIYFLKKLISFVPGSSSELAALGQNLFGGVIEEANFFPVVTGSKRLRFSLETEYDLAKRLHDSMWRRIESRYQRRGRIPGMLILNSSANYPGDFLDRMAGHLDKYTMCIDHSEWETQPQSRYSGKKFFVFVGNKYTLPKILKTEDELELYRQKGDVIAVPEEYADDFVRDLAGSLRDIGGMTVRSTNKFILETSRIYSMFDETRAGLHIPIPFAERYYDGMPAEDFPDNVAVDKFLNPVSHIRKTREALVHPKAMRFVHVDLATSKDSAGIAIGHVGRLDEVKRRREGSMGLEQVKEVVPVIYVDLAIRIRPSFGHEVQIDSIRDLLHTLNQEVGFRFAKITFDNFQSFSTIQLLTGRFGEDVVGILPSPSKKPDAPHWWSLRDAINEGRVFCYEYAPLRDEILGLEHNPVTKVIDHPVDGSHDVAEAVAGMIFNVMQNYEVGLAGEMSPGISSRPESLEGRLERESREWLMDDKKKPAKKKDEPTFNEDEWDIEKLRDSDFARQLEREEKEQNKSDEEE